MKNKHPYYSHRKMSGYLRNNGYWISESSYRTMKQEEVYMSEIVAEYQSDADKARKERIKKNKTKVSE